jgi:hypothetical protein
MLCHCLRTVCRSALSIISAVVRISLITLNEDCIAFSESDFLSMYVSHAKMKIKRKEEKINIQSN